MFTVVSHLLRKIKSFSFFLGAKAVFVADALDYKKKNESVYFKIKH